MLFSLCFFIIENAYAGMFLVNNAALEHACLSVEKNKLELRAHCESN